MLATERETWQRVLDINLTGVFLCCKHGIPKLLAASGGSVINMGSISGLVGSATSQIAYAASKGGVIALTRDVAVELARRGVRANAICPGPVETPLAMQLYGDPVAWERRRVHLPMGRLGTPDEIAETALFLASDESAGITGSLDRRRPRPLDRLHDSRRLTPRSQGVSQCDTCVTKVCNPLASGSCDMP